MLMWTHTHLVVASKIACRYKLIGNRPLITLADTEDDNHEITLTLKDLDAVDGLIAALTKGRHELAPTWAGEAA